MCPGCWALGSSSSLSSPFGQAFGVRTRTVPCTAAFCSPVAPPAAAWRRGEGRQEPIESPGLGRAPAALGIWGGGGWPGTKGLTQGMFCNAVRIYGFGFHRAAPPAELRPLGEGGGGGGGRHEAPDEGQAGKTRACSKPPGDAMLHQASRQTHQRPRPCPVPTPHGPGCALDLSGCFSTDKPGASRPEGCRGLPPGLLGALWGQTMRIFESGAPRGAPGQVRRPTPSCVTPLRGSQSRSPGSSGQILPQGDSGHCTKMMPHVLPLAGDSAVARVGDDT